MKKKRHYSHGEFNLFEIDGIPKGATRIYPTKEQIAKNGFIIAPSEISGNHHCVEMTDTVEFYQKDGVLYLKNTEPVNLFCVDESRHDTIEVPPSIWKGKPSKEVDHLLKLKRDVSD